MRCCAWTPSRSSRGRPRPTGEVRRHLAGELRRGGRADEASTINNTRWALLNNPQSLSTDQRSTLAGIQATNGPLYRTYLLKEQLRAVFQTRRGV
ncbi:MAG: transposase [Pseudonocardiaceae bacterium]